MIKQRFKLYKKADYCEDSLVYLLIKSAIILAWEDVYDRCKLPQKNRVRYELITPNTKLEEILFYACGKNNYAKNSFNYYVINSLYAAFDKKTYNWFNIKTTIETKGLTLFQVYNIFKEYSVSKNLTVEREKMFHEKTKSKYI